MSLLVDSGDGETEDDGPTEDGEYTPPKGWSDRQRGMARTGPPPTTPEQHWLVEEFGDRSEFSIALTPDMEIIWASPAMRMLMRVSAKEDVRKKSVFRYWPEERREEIECYHHAVWRGENVPHFLVPSERAQLLEVRRMPMWSTSGRVFGAMTSMRSLSPIHLKEATDHFFGSAKGFRPLMSFLIPASYLGTELRHKQLAGLLLCSRATILRHVAQLKDAGVIDVTTEARRGSRFKLLDPPGSANL